MTNLTELVAKTALAAIGLVSTPAHDFLNKSSLINRVSQKPVSDCLLLSVPLLNVFFAVQRGRREKAINKFANTPEIVSKANHDLFNVGSYTQPTEVQRAKAKNEKRKRAHETVMKKYESRKSSTNKKLPSQAPSRRVVELVLDSAEAVSDIIDQTSLRLTGGRSDAELVKEGKNFFNKAAESMKNVK